jgi:hypothetical protein
MDSMRFAQMVDRVAGIESIAGSEKDPVEIVDESVDSIISAIEAIGASLPLIDADTPEEKAAVKLIQDTMETAIIPYMVDIAKSMDVFVGAEE